MGYDCTLHLIDEADIRKVFAPAILAGTSNMEFLGGDSDFEQCFEDFYAALEKKDFSSAASLLCILLLLYSSTKLPACDERGVALSLLKDIPEWVGEGVPAELICSTEALFADITSIHPGLKGCFPSEFIGNWSPGVYIAAENVPAFLGWLESRIAELPKRDKEVFEMMRVLLTAAAKHGFAYYEGTDLPVEQTDDVEQRLHELAKIPYGVYAVATAPISITLLDRDREFNISSVIGDTVFAHSILSRKSMIVTFTGDQVRPDLIPEKRVYSVCGFNERFAVVSWDNATEELSYRIYNNLLDESPFQELPLPCVNGVPLTWCTDGEDRLDTCELDIVDGYLILFPSMNMKEIREKIKVPLMLVDGAYITAPGVEDVEWGSDHDAFGVYHVRNFYYGIIHLRDSREFLIWDGVVYAWRGKRFKRLFDLNAKISVSDFSYVEIQDGTVFYPDDRTLASVNLDTGEIYRHLPKVDSIMRITAGPENSILITEGNSPRKDIGKLYFPLEDAVIYLESEIFGEKKPFDLDNLYWNERNNCFFTFGDHGKHLVSVPGEHILSLPKRNPKTGRKVKTK